MPLTYFATSRPGPPTDGCVLLVFLARSSIAFHLGSCSNRRDRDELPYVGRVRGHGIVQLHNRTRMQYE